MTGRTLDDDLRVAARSGPEREAIVAGDRRVTYGELDRAVSGVAAGLRELGLKRGDRVAIALPNVAEAAIAIYGTLRAGAAFSPLNPTIKPAKVGYILRDCGARVLVCDPPLVEVVARARAEAPDLAHVVTVCGEDASGTTLQELAARPPTPAPAPLDIDLAAIIYTSGSTGLPKGAALIHRNMTFAAESIVEYLGIGRNDRVLCVLPLSFDYGLYQLLMSVRVAATIVLQQGFAFAGRVVALLERERITVLPGVPTVFDVLTSLRGLANRRLPHLRLLTSTGAALSTSAITAIRRTFPDAELYSMYGLTECKRVSYLPPTELDKRPDSVGVPIPGTEAWIENEEGRELAPGEVGELIVRGAHVMQGYWNDPQATAARLRPGRWPWERVLATGDLFRRDQEGFLYFVGRRDDIIKSRGEKVAPREVENALCTMPAVREAAVVGVPDHRLGETVHAHVSLHADQDLDPAELRRRCAARLEDYMVPQRVVLHEDLPKTANGKIDKRALAAQSEASAVESSRA